MAYQPITNFGVKDTLGPDNPNKIIYGADLQVEFNAIADNLESVGDELTEIGDVVEEAPSDNVVYGRKNDEWVSVTVEAGGVSEAPVDGKQYARQDADWAEIATPDGGIPEAPTDGKQYARESAGWTEVVDAPTAWGDVTGKPSEFPPSSHGHAWGEITGKPSEFPPSSHGHSITEVTGLQAALTDIDATSVKSGTFTETVRAPRYQGGSATLELNLANNFLMDFSGATVYGLGLSGAPSGAGDAYGFTLTLDTTNMAGLAWDAKIKWSTGTAPTLNADSSYVFTFLTTDGGTTFKAFVGGEGFA
jgi:hypothetical protein